VFRAGPWNGRDPILKERLFGLTNPEGNHGEDVKEVYFYLDATPTHSYLKALYRYPQAEFPYQRLRDENRRRGRDVPEFELTDTGRRSTATASSTSSRVRQGQSRRHPDPHQRPSTAARSRPRLHVLPTLWFRNTWSWGAAYDEGRWPKPNIAPAGPGSIVAEHTTLGRFRLAVSADGRPASSFSPRMSRITPDSSACPNASPHVKDAFHAYVIRGRCEHHQPRRRHQKRRRSTSSTCRPAASTSCGLRLTAEAEAACRGRSPIRCGHCRPHRRRRRLLRREDSAGICRRKSGRSAGRRMRA